MTDIDEAKLWAVDGMSELERSFRCPHCDMFVGWTDGQQLRTRASIITNPLEMLCAGCDQTYEWNPTTLSENG